MIWALVAILLTLVVVIAGTWAIECHIDATTKKDEGERDELERQRHMQCIADGKPYLRQPRPLARR